MESYGKCFIPWCNNDSKNSKKTIVRIREDLREQWCRQVNVEYFKGYTQYCCEDHFDPNQALLNRYFKLAKQQPRFIPTAKLQNVPFNAKNIIEDNKEMREISSVSKTDDSELAKLLLNSHPVLQTGKRKYVDYDMPSTSGEISSHPFKVQIAVQASPIMADKATNTSFKSSKFSINSTAEQSSSTPVPEPPTLFNFTAESEESEIIVKEEFILRKINLDNVYRSPEMCLGLSKQYIWLIDFIVAKSSNIDSLCIIVTLLIIKQNYTIERLSDELEISRTELSTMIPKGIESLSNFFRNLISSPLPKATVKRNLDILNIEYTNVQMIIDSFEIQIAEPSNPLMRAQTWSRYKRKNTVRYLIGCIPNGLISFISNGYGDGGRISHKSIVEKSSLLDVLQPNAIVLADRGFEEIEGLLRSRGFKLFRPRSSGVMQSKVIPSLRIHVEQAIRRITEFLILKPHSVVDQEYVPYLDEIVTIACGLINLEEEIVKKE